MPVVYTQNKGGKAVIRDTTTATYTIAGSAGVSNVASVAETIVGASISQIWWTGDWTVKRGANTVLVLKDSGSWDLNGSGINLGEFPAATLVVEAANTGTIIVELSKNSDFVSEYLAG
jgi:hypothetical protein